MVTTGSESESTDPFLRKLQLRLLPSHVKATKYFAAKNIEKQKKTKELLTKRSDRLTKQVQFYRTYRVGDFPDIEIPRSAVVDPLKMLSKVKSTPYLYSSRLGEFLCSGVFSIGINLLKCAILIRFPSFITNIR